MFDDPDFQFEEKYVLIKDNNSSVKYYYCNKSLLTIPTQEVQMPGTSITIDMKHSVFSELQKASSVLQVQDLTIKPSADGETIIALVHDRKDTTSNEFFVELGDNPTDIDYSFDFNMGLLRLFPGNYKVNLTKTVISEFIHEDIDLRYWVALMSSSKYDS